MSAAMNDPRLLQMSTFLIDYPFADRLFTGALRAIEHIQPDGDPVGRRCGAPVAQGSALGLWQAVDGRVLIYIKDLMLDTVQWHYPARHYVMVDDKLRVLPAMKQSLGQRLRR